MIRSAGVKVKGQLSGFECLQCRLQANGSVVAFSHDGRGLHKKRDLFADEKKPGMTSSGL
jgi:hypothetical protein